MKQKKKKTLQAGRLIALVFAGLILIGTALLCLPIASRTGVSAGLRKSLFTATSCTCVTGLILEDTWVQWSGFGQVVILCLIQIGGLGFMSINSLFALMLRKKLSVKQRLVLAEAIGVDGIGDIVRLSKRILAGTFLIEGTGALILTLRFWRDFGFLTSLKLGVFHSISAFCNAGFDILGFKMPGGSLIPYGSDPVVSLTLAALIILGGLGYVVWDEVVRIRNPKKWSVYTKLVLITTGSLLLLGMAFFCLTEWNNPETMGNFSVGGKLVAAFFQSATTRTAGFAGIDQGAMTEASKAGTIFLMLIGGSSGSTAGGLKTVTFAVLLLFLWSRIRGKKSVSAFHRSVSDEQVLNALTLFGVMVGLTFAGAIFMAAMNPVSFVDSLYETVSALATVGLTTGITSGLSLATHLMLICFMYFGRVGILTISMGFLREDAAEKKYRYAKTDLMIG